MRRGTIEVISIAHRAPPSKLMFLRFLFRDLKRPAFRHVVPFHGQVILVRTLVRVRRRSRFANCLIRNIFLGDRVLLQMLPVVLSGFPCGRLIHIIHHVDKNRAEARLFGHCGIQSGAL